VGHQVDAIRARRKSWLDWMRRTSIGGVARIGTMTSSHSQPSAIERQWMTLRNRDAAKARRK